MTLDCPRGQLTSLLGPSGCGETTLLKIIAGLLEPTSCEIIVTGKPVTGPGPNRAFVFQDFALMPWASVIKNVGVGLELRGVPKSEREDISMKYFRNVGLDGIETSYPQELSGGMRQRAGLACALAVMANVLLLYKQFSAVDKQNRRNIQEDIRPLLRMKRRHSSSSPTRLKRRFMCRIRSRFLCHVQAVCPKLSDLILTCRNRGTLCTGTRSVWTLWNKLGRHCAHMWTWGNMKIFGFNLPMMSSLLIWALLWEIVGQDVRNCAATQLYQSVH